MVKKLLTLTLSLFMAFSLCMTVCAEGETVVAKIGDVEYTTLQSAISAGDGKTIELIANTTEDITIESGKTITLNINDGVTLKNISSHTIVNNGTLTITGSGTVDNVTHEKGDIVNNYGATANLKGNVSYTRSQEAGKDKNNSGGNSWYNIDNHGTMTISENVSVISNGGFSSLIRNKGETQKDAILTIKSGNFSGGLNTVKNDEHGKLYIENGSFSNTTQATLLNWNDAQISGGTFSPTSSATSSIITGIYTDGKDDYDAASNTGKVVISSGIFNGALSFYSNENYIGKYKDGTFTISGGTFSDDVTKYLATDKTYNAVKNSEGKYVVVEEGAKVEVKEDVATTPALEETAYNETKSVVETLNQSLSEDQKITFNETTKVELKSNVITETSSEDSNVPTFTKEQEEKVEEKVVEEVSKEISSTVDTNNIELIPLDITLNVVNTKSDGGKDETKITTVLANPITVTLYLNDNTLSKLEGKIVKVIRIHKDKEGKETIDVLPATLKNNALSFETDRFSTYVIASYTVPSTTTTDTPVKSYDLKDTNQDGVISCEEEMNNANWIWSNTKKACVYKVSNTGVK